MLFVMFCFVLFFFCIRRFKCMNFMFYYTVFLLKKKKMLLIILKIRKFIYVNVKKNLDSDLMCLFENDHWVEQKTVVQVIFIFKLFFFPTLYNQIIKTNFILKNMIKIFKKKEN